MEDPAPYVVNPQLQPLPGVPVAARSRFVQQADVDAAAFALLKDRTRPTVEKVRARLGRGSPNTIGPLLEKWFAQLADRLEGVPAAGSALDLPAAVANGARLLWHTALGEAREQAARELAGVREKLEGERRQLEAERAQVQEEGRVLAATRAALEEGMRLAQEQAAELRAVLEDRTQKLGVSSFSVQ
jgi:uncharacterized protein (DUF2267 family)